MNTFMGYERPDGSIGIRNHVAILPSVACVNGVAGMISRAVPEAISLCHGHGCGRGGEEAKRHARTLANIARNPNIAAVLILGLGCEIIKGDMLAERVAQCGKPVEFIQVQKEGGSLKAAKKGIEIVRRFIEAARKCEAEPFPLNRLTIGLECGGSDSFSGITANPGVGCATDWIVDQGGTAILTETTEMIGTGHILSQRACSPAVAEAVTNMVGQVEKKTFEMLGPHAHTVISPGNMDGGMTSIQEKSLGCITKGGTRPINGVVGYGERPDKKGLILMDGPGYDMESLTGLAAAGAQVMIFTTGRGTPAGFPVIPVIKVASNSGLYHNMIDDMDLNGGAVLEGKSIQEFGADVVDMIRKVLNGEQTKAEKTQIDPNIYLRTTGRSF